MVFLGIIELGIYLNSMKIKIIITITLLLINSYAHAIYGGQAGSLFAYAAEARSCAMGRAYVALSDDASSVYWNPGAMMEVGGISGTFMSASMFEATSLSVMSFVWPGLYESYGFGMVTLGNTLAGEKTDKDNKVIGSWADARSAMVMGYSKRFYHNLSGGLSFKMFNRTLDTSADSWFLFDLGLLYKPTDRVSIGGVLNNVYTMNNSPEMTSDEIPMIWRGGIAYKGDEYTVAFDVTDTFNQWYLGFEYQVIEMLLLRAGMNYEEFTFGMGVEYSMFKFDIAMGSQEAGGSMKFSLGMTWGDNQKEISKETNKKIVEAGNYFDKGFYNLAKMEYESIGVLERPTVGVQKQIQKLDKVLSLKDVTLKEEKRAWEHFSKAMEHMKKRRLKKALDEARRAEKIMPSNSTIYGLVRLLKNTVGE